ncbi:MAG TPA: PHP domain-containing protein [bacterium]|nr:PHP domain-containing protein [bacterium]
MSGPGRADLHTHTWHSDGRHSPQEVVERARNAGVGTLAVTDHETVAGIGEALEAGRAAGIEIIPGIELATRIKAVEAHIVGLWIDVAAPSLRDTIELLQAERGERAKGMVARLQGLGVRIGMEDVIKATGKGSIGRPHVAQALVNVGAVASFQKAFERYLGNRGPAYIPRKHLTPARAIEIIHGAGGVATLAHGLIGGPAREHVMEIAAMGLDAVEVVHPKLNAGQSAWLREFARARGLGVTGGSDWHGEGWSEGEIGEFTVSLDEVRELMKKKKQGY